jgi:hypothetical protein
MSCYLIGVNGILWSIYFCTMDGSLHTNLEFILIFLSLLIGYFSIVLTVFVGKMVVCLCNGHDVIVLV